MKEDSNRFTFAYCYDGATGQMRHYVRSRHWRGLWSKRMVLMQGQP
jgi:hypothetical protein